MTKRNRRDGSANAAPTTAVKPVETKTGEHGFARVQGGYERFLHSGKVFGAVTWILQAAIEFSVIYGVTLAAAVYPVPYIINAFLSVASEVGRMEMFYVPVAFVCLIFALVLVRVYAMLWHALDRWLGGLRARRVAELAERYGADGSK